MRLAQCFDFEVEISVENIANKTNNNCILGDDLPKEDSPVDRGCARYCWPVLQDIGLSDVELKGRRRWIGGSDANIILWGDKERVVDLWRIKRGEIEAEDLSSVLQVMLGCWTEAFNRQWYERVSGRNVTRCGEVVRCPSHSWRRCTLDGFVEDRGAVWESKHTSAFASTEDVIARYMPQLQHNMAVTGAQFGILSVIFGNQKFETIEIAADWLYQAELLDAEREFWECVRTGREPCVFGPPPPPRPVGIREICLEGNNAWASAAVDWLQTRHAAQTFASAKATIKDLMEDDVRRAFGHGIEAVRSKSGAITVREAAA